MVDLLNVPKENLYKKIFGTVLVDYDIDKPSSYTNDEVKKMYPALEILTRYRLNKRVGTLYKDITNAINTLWPYKRVGCRTELEKRYSYKVMLSYLTNGSMPIFQDKNMSRKEKHIAAF